MAMHTDGINCWATSPKTGKMEYIPPTSCSINKKKAYEFDSEKGILRINASESDLEKMLAKIGNIPEQGISLTMPLPFMQGEAHYFSGVKKIERIPNEEPFMKSASIEKAKEGILYKIKRYIFGE